MTVQPVDLQSSFTTLPVCKVTSKGWVPTRLLNAAGGVRLTGCYDRSYSLRQPRFAFISLSQAEWDNKMESRGGLRFFEYVSSFIHEGGYLSSQSWGATLLSASLSVHRYISMLMADAEGTDEWLSDATGYGLIFGPAGIEFEFCKPGFVSHNMKLWFKNRIWSNLICFPRTKLLKLKCTVKRRLHPH